MRPMAPIGQHVLDSPAPRLGPEHQRLCNNVGLSTKRHVVKAARCYQAKLQPWLLCGARPGLPLTQWVAVLHPHNGTLGG